MANGNSAGDASYRRRMSRVAMASFVGTTIEWYDFFLYGTMAALVFSQLFFAKLDPATGTIASFATFAAGFLARPIGGIAFGYFGDRAGRKASLIASLSLMGASTLPASGQRPRADVVVDPRGLAAAWVPSVRRHLRWPTRHSG